MRSCGLWCAAGVLLSLIGQSSLNAQTKVSVGEVREMRTGGKHNFGMHVTLVVEDATLLQDAKEFRIVVAKATDDLGNDLLNQKHKLSESYRTFVPKERLSIELINPPRRSSAIQELTGEIDFFVPQRDPSATVVINSFLKQPASSAASALLAASGVELDAPTEVVHGSETIEMHSVNLSYKDRDDRVIGFEFVDSAGSTVRPAGWGFPRQHGDTMIRSFTFRDGLTASVSLIVDLATPAALVRIPFSLTNIPLP